ncbi:MAG: sigma-70 family RNA polymerase sigma factor [Atopobiaceae bacterium]|jgi:RNA polymerase sigma-70 factor (ECF subfamily)|nr:sigma-70 family RNA polymerase sigma factor [Atopobiaceae bacterium]
MRSSRRRAYKLTRDDLTGLFEEYYPRVFNYLYYRTLNRAVSDDLVSTVMLNVVRSYESFDPTKGNLESWIFRIARNALFSYYRQRKESVDVDAVSPEVLSYTDDEDVLDEQGAMVRKALETLTEEERELVYLKYWEELSNKEIAARLDLNPSTVSTQLWRANQKMKKVVSLE